MRRIRLSRGLFATVDDEDYPKLVGFKWSVKPSEHGGMYAVTNIKENGRWHQELMHRKIMGNPPGKDVIFLDYDGLNCRKKNLRIVDAVESRRHHRVRRDSYTQIKGVALNLEEGSWSPIIVVNSTPKNLGEFDDVEEAKQVYDEAVKQNYGAYAPMHRPVGNHTSAARSPNPAVPPPQRPRKPKNMPTTDTADGVPVGAGGSVLTGIR